MRYTSYGKPAFLVNEALDDGGVRFYLDTLYALDPLHKLGREVREASVVSLRSLGDGAADDERYMVELFKSAFIFDELAILLPAPGGGSIAVCCERRSVKFRDRDRKLIEKILPVVASLHRLHVDKAFALACARGDADVAGQQSAFMILDQSGRIVHESPQWLQFNMSGEATRAVLEAVSQHGEGVLAYQDDHIVHWEPLRADFQLAPGGKIVTVEPNGAASLRVTLEDGLEVFRRRWNFTDRETDIVRLILIGYPNAHIARELGISAGTVRNHRHRLYYKLDVTTERELFSMFLSQITGAEGAEPAASNQASAFGRSEIRI